VNVAATKQGELITELATKLDTGMQNEITRSMQFMADQLAAITGKFVDDYTELTTHMQQVLQQNRGRMQ